MNWYLEALKKYAVFNGRARRKEYWIFVLFNAFIMIVLAVIDDVIGVREDVEIVLYNDHGVSTIPNLLENLQESLVVARVKPDRRLV